MTVTCHEFRVRADPTLQGPLGAGLDTNVFGRFTEVLGDRREPVTVAENDPAFGGASYLQTRFRLVWVPNIDGMLTAIEGTLQSADWYAIDHLECHHDLETGVGTEPDGDYERVRTGGTVPEAI